MRPPSRAAVRIPTISRIGALAGLGAPAIARVEWGTSDWGAFNRGEGLALVPLLDPIGLVLLLAAAVGFGVWWLRSGGRGRTPSG